MNQSASRVTEHLVLSSMIDMVDARLKQVPQYTTIEFIDP